MALILQGPGWQTYAFRFELADAFPDVKEAVMSGGQRLAQANAFLSDTGHQKQLQALQKEIADFVYEKATQAMNDCAAEQTRE